MDAQNTLNQIVSEIESEAAELNLRIGQAASEVRQRTRGHIEQIKDTSDLLRQSLFAGALVPQGSRQCD